MSNTAKNAATPADVKALTEEKTVPAQNTGEKPAATTSAVTIDTMIDGLDLTAEMMANGFKVQIVVDDEGNRSLQVVQGNKAQKLLAGAKGVFQRNKKLVIATAALATTSLVLKAIARRNAELETDEVVESSDDVPVDA